MKIVFFGTPEFAARCLGKLILSKHEISAVVCGPDRPKGRGRKMSIPEVKMVARENGLNVLQPRNLKDADFINILTGLEAEFFAVVAFRILPEEVYSIPPRGCVNLHASLLPAYRGAAPINWSIINGETETGLTTFFIRKKVDTGEIILQRKLDIGPDETFGELYGRMADLGGDLLVDTVDLAEKGVLRLKKQDDSLASSAPKINSDLGRIDWNQPSEKIRNLIRGLSPIPGAFTFLRGRRIYILRSSVTENPDSIKPGIVIKADNKKGLAVSCGEGALEILQIKPESRGIMSGAEFVRGGQIEKDDSFGEEN